MQEGNIVQIINGLTTTIKEISSKVLEMDNFGEYCILIIGAGLIGGIFFFAAKLASGNYTDQKKIISETKRILIILILGLLSTTLIQYIDHYAGSIESAVERLQSSSNLSDTALNTEQATEVARRANEGYKDLSQEDYDRVNEIQKNSLISNDGSYVEKQYNSENTIVANATNVTSNSDMIETDKLFEKSCLRYTWNDWFVVSILTISACIKLLATALLCLIKLIATLLCPIAFSLSFFPKFEDTYKTWLYSYVAVVLTFPVMSIIEYISVRFATLASTGNESSIIISSIMSLFCAVAIWLCQQFTTAFLCGSQSLGSIGTSVLATTYMGSKMAGSLGMNVGGRVMAGLNKIIPQGPAPAAQAEPGSADIPT